MSYISQTWKIELKNYCAYNPQSTALVERNNGTIKTKLKKTKEETGQNWLYCQPLVMLNIHVTPASAGLPPLQSCMGDHTKYSN